MAKAEILSEIKEAEEKAKLLVEDADEAKSKKISKARVEAREILRQAEAEAEESADSSLRSAQEDIKAEREKIIDEGKKEADSLKAKASTNMDKAVDYLLNEFERSIYAQS